MVVFSSYPRYHLFINSYLFHSSLLPLLPFSFSFSFLNPLLPSFFLFFFCRTQDKERASHKAKGRALKLPPAAADGSSPQAADPLNKSLEDTASRQEGGSEHSTMPLPAAAAGFHIDGELDELEHKIYALTHCISMLATN
eukprot:TRINITY_DN28472_c0_g1_i1.p1 TRINITY_DN28472_c0_g1~~TRINITY_DN28472_c0_g1_i1.p1  ORF type:complete len:140 (-),score=0.41 TRINITY_DN28472_c0_g1_i1:139-558(-)